MTSRGVRTMQLWMGRCNAKYGYGERNKRGEKLLEFAAKPDMCICNTERVHMEIN